MIAMLAQSDTITDTALRVDWDSLGRVLLLEDYNTRIIVLSTVVLGATAGLVGSFLLLRKRALMGDALSHATLPGIAVAFLIATAVGVSGKTLPVLLLGATVFGLLGVGAVMAIKRYTRLKDDAALGIVLSVFFGFGTALLGVIQGMAGGNAAGLNSFIDGTLASTVMSDLYLIIGVAIVAAVTCLLLFKEFTVLCFDDDYAAAQGWPVGWLDAAMLALVTAVTVIGLQSVGLILIIALLIIPAAAARFWTDRLGRMTLIAAIIGAVSGWLGAVASALVNNAPTGAIIVVTAASMFIVSMIFGSARGVLVRGIRHAALVVTVGRQHLLRAFYESIEGTESRTVGFDRLLAKRSWSAPRLSLWLRFADRAGVVAPAAVDGRRAYRLTDDGFAEAERVVRNHRLWELYLITHADIAPSHVDRDADRIEHVLGPQMVAKLERLLAEQAGGALPDSPHRIDPTRAASHAVGGLAGGDP